MALTPISGKYGDIENGSGSLGMITGWTLNKQAVSGRFCASNSNGFKLSIPGVQSASGTAEMKLDTALACPNLEGTGATFKLYIDASHYYSVPAIITKMSVKVDIDEGMPVSATLEFDSNGAYVEPTFP